MLFLEEEKARRAGQAEGGQVRCRRTPAARIAVIGMEHVALDGHQQRAQAFQQHSRGIAGEQDGRVGCARSRDGEHVHQRGQEQNAGKRAAYAAFKHDDGDPADAARVLPVFAEEPEGKIQRGQQRAGEHEVVIDQRVDSAKEREQPRPGRVAHGDFDAQQNQREERNDLREVIELGVDHREGRKRIEHGACQRKACVAAQHAPEIEKGRERRDGMLEDRHQADAKGNEGLRHKRQRPDERAAQRIKAVAAHGGRAQEGRKREAVQPAVQDAPGFKDEGQLLLDKIAARHKAPAVRDDCGKQRKEREQRAEKKRMRSRDARAGSKRMSSHMSPA